MKTSIRIFLFFIIIGFVGLMASGFAPLNSVIGLWNSTCCCVMLDENNGLVGADAEYINGPQSNLGNTVVKCVKSGMVNSSGNALIKRGGNGTTCFAFGMETDDWHEVITPNGEATLICIFPDHGK